MSFSGATYGVTVAPGSNRLGAAAGPSPAKTYGYDAAGNIQSDATNTFAYGDNGRMRSATVSGGTVTYLYNGLGQRATKFAPVALVPSGKTDFVYDTAGRLIGEYNSSGHAMQETAYLGNTPVVVFQRSPTGVMTPFNVYADHIDTPRVVVQPADSAIVWRWDHADPFGASMPTASTVWNAAFGYNLRFPGQVYDRETGLHYNYFRDYDPQTGRYIQSDPIGLSGGVNTYGYVGGNPLSYTDPLGLFETINKRNSSLNTMVCDGKGNLVVQLGPMSEAFRRCGLEECVVQHERSHISDAMAQNPKVCGGWFSKVPSGILVGASSIAEKNTTESKAYDVSIRCFQKKLAECTSDECSNLIKSNIDLAKRKKTDYQ